MSKREAAMAKHQNGKLLWLEVDVGAYEALMGIDVPQTILDKLPPIVQSLIEAPTKLVRLGATVLSPGFAIRNTLRDVAGDYVFTSAQNKAWLFSGVARQGYDRAAEVKRGSEAVRRARRRGVDLLQR